MITVYVNYLVRAIGFSAVIVLLGCLFIGTMGYGFSQDNLWILLGVVAVWAFLIITWASYIEFVTRAKARGDLPKLK